MKEELGWSQSGTLITFNPNRAIVLQQQFPKAGNYTVQFGFNTPANALVRPKALISWNVKGNQVEREISPNNGTSVTGQAEAVIVKIYDDLRTGMLGTPGIAYTATINVTRGSRSVPGQQAPLFLPIDAQNPVGTPVTIDRAIVVASSTVASVPIPKGATQVWVYATDATTVAPPVPGTAIVRFVDPTGAGVLASFYPNSQFWAQIVPTATEIRLAALGANAINYQVIFGIDG